MDRNNPLAIPIVAAVATGVVAAIGWAASVAVNRWMPGDIVVTLAHPTEMMTFLEPHQQTFNGEPVYCDTLKASLQISHSINGTVAILVDRIELKAARLDQAEGSKLGECHVNHLSSRPYGIQPRDTFIVSVSKIGVSVRYVRSEKPGQAWPVPIDNLLDFKDGHKSWSLQSTESPLAYDILVYNQIASPFRIWFEVSYNAGGTRVQKTAPFIIMK